MCAARSLMGDTTQSNWAIYQIPAATDFYPESLRLFFGGNGNLWVMLSDYAAGHWTLASPDALNHAIYGDWHQSDIIPIEDWSTLQSPAGNLYLLLYATDGQVNLDSIDYSMELQDPLPPPTGLTAQWTDFGLFFQWDPYNDTRAQYIRLYMKSFKGPSQGPPWDWNYYIVQVSRDETAYMYIDAPINAEVEYAIAAYSESYQQFGLSEWIVPGPKP